MKRNLHDGMFDYRKKLMNRKISGLLNEFLQTSEGVSLKTLHFYWGDKLLKFEFDKDELKPKKNKELQSNG